MKKRLRWAPWAQYPLVQQFLTGAMRANSAPTQYVYDTEPTAKQKDLLAAGAERQLRDWARQMAPSHPHLWEELAFGLGYCADQGWTTCITEDDGETREDMLAYKILEEEY